MATNRAFVFPILVLLEFIGKQKIAEMTEWLDEHIDAERAKLGWPPATC